MKPKKYEIWRKIQFSLENNIFSKNAPFMEVSDFSENTKFVERLSFHSIMAFLTQNLTIPRYIIGSYNPRASTGA